VAGAVRTLAAVVLVAVSAAVLGTGAPAHAHGGPGVLELRSEDSVLEGPSELEVAVTYENDGEPAEGALVDATARGPAGSVTPAVRFAQTGDAGVYRASIDLPAPGPWTVTVTSSFPPGSLVVPVTVRPAPPDATAGLAATSATTGTTTSGPTVPSLDEPEVGGAEGGTDRTNLVVAAVSGILGGALGLWASRRRSARRRARDGG
jgi:hypothetical protein